MAKINISDMVSLESQKDELRNMIKENQDLLLREIDSKLEPKLDQAKTDLFDAFEEYFSSKEFEVKRNSIFGLQATFKELHFEINYFEDEIIIKSNRNDSATVKVSNRRHEGPRVTSTITSSGKPMDIEFEGLKNRLRSLESDLKALDQITIYYHIDTKVFTSVSDTLNYLFE